jgi:hypothetical protein
MKIDQERPEDEALDNAMLRAVFDRQLRVSLLVDQITVLLYKARGEWIGGAMDFKDLTAAQKASYRAEVEALVKQPIMYARDGIKLGLTRINRGQYTTTIHQPQGDGDSTDFDGRTEAEKESL